MTRPPGLPNSWGRLLYDNYLSPAQKLAAAIVLQAIKDLNDPRVKDEDYSSAVDFFAPSPFYERLAAEDCLDLSDYFLDLCQQMINGREVVPIQVWLW